MASCLQNNINYWSHLVFVEARELLLRDIFVKSHVGASVAPLWNKQVPLPVNTSAQKLAAEWIHHLAWLAVVHAGWGDVETFGPLLQGAGTPADELTAAASGLDDRDKICK